MRKKNQLITYVRSDIRIYTNSSSRRCAIRPRLEYYRHCMVILRTSAATASYFLLYTYIYGYGTNRVGARTCVCVSDDNTKSLPIPFSGGGGCAGCDRQIIFNFTISLCSISRSRRREYKCLENNDQQRNPDLFYLN